MDNLGKKKIGVRELCLARRMFGVETEKKEHWRTSILFLKYYWVITH